jgi:hypothetical protein
VLGRLLGSAPITPAYSSSTNTNTYSIVAAECRDWSAIAMRISKRIVLAATMSWIYSVTLGLIFSINWDGKLHFNLLLVPAAYYAPTIFSTICALLIAPVAFWSIGNGIRRHLIFGPIVWLIIAVYESAAPFASMAYDLAGALLLAVLGLVVLRVVPVTK